MRFLKKNTAVIVSVGPFYDATNGVTIENALTITNERITLVADTDDGSAPTMILDNVTGATSGTDNDLNYITNCDAGMMQLELSAANTNRNGRLLLSITDAANHVPVFHEFTVLDAAVYDSLILGTDKLAVDAQEISSDATAADNAELMFDGTGYAGGTTKLGVDVVNWKGSAAPAMTGDSYARLGAPAGASVSADVAAVKSDTGAIKAKTDNLPTDPADDSDIDAQLAAIAGYLDTEIAAIKAKTDNLPASPAATGDAMTLASGAVSATALASDAVDEILDEPVEGSLTLRQAVRIVLAALAGKASGGGTSTITFRDVADAKARITATVDGNGNRTAITLDAS